MRSHGGLHLGKLKSSKVMSRLISTINPSHTMIEKLRSKPEHIIPLIEKMSNETLDTHCYCLAITILSRLPDHKQATLHQQTPTDSNIADARCHFSLGLLLARDRLNVMSWAVFDLLILAWHCRSESLVMF
ncbi:hypothetical protein Leryth_019013 [Lithospermum erythrorhizon]|nr:hypothetical protein Leryth_019013 [Lithospermum erythrorhizon]